MIVARSSVLTTRQRVKRGATVIAAAGAAWDQTPGVRDWIDSSRLNVASGLLDHAGEPGVAQAIGSYLENSDQATENLGAFRAQLGDHLNDDI